MSIRPYAAELTPRQLDVLRELAAGKTQRQAAAAAGMSFNTARNRLTPIYEVLDAANIAHAIALLDDYRPGWRPRLPFPARPRTIPGSALVGESDTGPAGERQ